MGSENPEAVWKRAAKKFYRRAVMLRRYLDAESVENFSLLEEVETLRAEREELRLIIERALQLNNVHQEHGGLLRITSQTALTTSLRAFPSEIEKRETLIAKRHELLCAENKRLAEALLTLNKFQWEARGQCMICLHDPSSGSDSGHAPGCIIDRAWYLCNL